MIKNSKLKESIDGLIVMKTVAYCERHTNNFFDASNQNINEYQFPLLQDYHQQLILFVSQNEKGHQPA